jgi:hypothetical protein
MIMIEKIPQFEFVGGKYPWRVTAPLVLTIGYDEYEVPIGYRTDFASVPRIPFIYARYGGKANIPALWHDWCYDCGKDEFTRKEADDQFYELMTLFNDPPRWAQRYAMWMGVRLGGWRGWNQDSSEKCR